MTENEWEAKLKVAQAMILEERSRADEFRLQAVRYAAQAEDVDALKKERAELEKVLRESDNHYLEGLHGMSIELKKAEQDRDALREELSRRKGDPVTRLHNLCEGIAHDADGSEWSTEEWERIDKENSELKKERDELRAEIANVKHILSCIDEFDEPVALDEETSEVAGLIHSYLCNVYDERNTYRDQCEYVTKERDATQEKLNVADCIKGVRACSAPNLCTRHRLEAQCERLADRMRLIKQMASEEINEGADDSSRIHQILTEANKVLEAFGDSRDNHKAAKRRCPRPQRNGLATTDNADRAWETIAERLAEALGDHHIWHQQSKDIEFVWPDGEKGSFDMGMEYFDSQLYEVTEKALAEYERAKGGG